MIQDCIHITAASVRQTTYIFIVDCEHTNLIPIRGGGDGVFSSQGNAASSYDQQDGHLKVPEVHHVVARSTHPEGQQRAERRRAAELSQHLCWNVDCACVSWGNSQGSWIGQHGFGAMEHEESTLNMLKTGLEVTHGLSCLKMNMLSGATVATGFVSSSSSFSALHISGSLLLAGEVREEKVGDVRGTGVRGMR